MRRGRVAKAAERGPCGCGCGLVCVRWCVCASPCVGGQVSLETDKECVSVCVCVREEGGGLKSSFVLYARRNLSSY